MLNSQKVIAMDLLRQWREILLAEDLAWAGVQSIESKLARQIDSVFDQISAGIASIKYFEKLMVAFKQDVDVSFERCRSIFFSKESKEVQRIAKSILDEYCADHLSEFLPIFREKFFRSSRIQLVRKYEERCTSY